MSGHHRRTVPSRAVGRRALGAGVAGVATVFAVAPGALADTGNLTPPDTGTSSAAQKPAQPATGPATPGSAATPRETTTHVTAKVAVEVAPNYGHQKIRLGVQIKDGSVVPPNVTTEGSVITITETGPLAPDPATTTCTTGGADTTAVPDSTATFCTFDSNGLLSRRAAGFKPALVHGPVPPEDNTGANYFAGYSLAPGDTLTIKQTKVNEGLIGDPVVGVIGPCVNDEGGADGFPQCPDFDQYVFEDTGPPPMAVDDTVNTCVGVPVDLDVLKNDASVAPVTALEISSGPDNGKAEVKPDVQSGSVKAHLAGASPFTVTYTPKAGFTGKDSFGYELNTANGSAGAKASIVVVGGPTAVDDSAKTESGKPVTIDVTANDDANGKSAVSISSVTASKHGQAKVENGSILYTPANDFVGTDSFDYTVRTGCGTATATVSIDVTGGAGTNNNNPTPLAETGVQSQDLLELSLALLLAGAGATGFGRRRARGRHAG